MGFFKNLFSGKEPSEKEREEKQQANNFDVLKYDGIQALRIGRSDYAIACLTHALGIQEDREAHIALVNAYMRKGEPENAVDELSELCELYPDEPSFAVNLAEGLYQLERYDDMEDACKNALKIDDTLAAPYYLLAKKELASDNLSGAEANVTKAIDNNKEAYEAYNLRAEIRLKDGRAEEGLTDIERLAANIDLSDEDLLLKGKILEAMNRDDEALECYESVIATNPFIQEAYSHCAHILLQKGESDKASEMINDAIEQNGENSTLIYLRSEIKAIHGDEKGSQEDKDLASKLLAEEKDSADKDVDIERETQERYSSINPFQ